MLMIQDAYQINDDVLSYMLATLKSSSQNR